MPELPWIPTFKPGEVQRRRVRTDGVWNYRRRRMEYLTSVLDMSRADLLEVARKAKEFDDMYLAHRFSEPDERGSI